MAKDRGIPVSIAADAHSTGALSHLDYGVTIDSYLLQLGWLRFMRFYGAEPILARLFPSTNLVKLQIIGLLLELLALVCTFAGSMYFFEA